jgi:hypothetical protein
MPSHIAGATAGSASRLASSVVIEIASKWKAISGAVASVAAVVIAAPSASARRQPEAPIRAVIASRSGEASRRMPSTAAKLSCQPTLPAMPGSSANIATAAKARANRREPRRPARVATRLSAPIAAARWIDGPAPASGT